MTEPTLRTLVPTYTATISCGLRAGYGGPARYACTRTPEDAERIARGYCDGAGLCVTVTPTRFIYPGGDAPGVLVGLINYPRFPSSPAVVRAHALALAERLRVELGQFRVTVVFPDETVMLGEVDP